MTQQLPVYARLGDDGTEHRIGWIEFDSNIHAVLATLFRQAADQLENLPPPREGP